MDRGRALMGVLGGLVSGLAFMAGSIAVVRALRTPPGAPANPAARVRVVLRTSVADAHVFVDGESCGIGKCEVELKPGVHEGQARKPGYSGEAREFTAAAKTPDVELNL